MARTNHQELRFGWSGKLKQMAAKGDREGHEQLVDLIRTHVDQIGVFDRQWVGILNGATHRGIAVEIDKAYAIELFRRQGRRCALSGLPIGFGGELTPPPGRRRWGTASLDRIDSGGAYAPGNVWWVHRDINRMKMDLPVARFIELCRQVADCSASLPVIPPSTTRPDAARPASKIEEFVTECCNVDPSRFETASVLLKGYNKWAAAHASPGCTAMAFGLVMGRLGFLREKRSVIYWRGLSLKTGEGERVDRDLRDTFAPPKHH